MTYRLFAIKDQDGAEKYATFTCDIHQAVVAVTDTHRTLSIEWCHARCVENEVARLQTMHIPCFVIDVSEIANSFAGTEWDFQIDRR